MGMKRTHRRRRCGQSTCNPRAPTKISAPMEPRLACERFCDHGRRHTLHRRSIPAPGSRIRAIPSAHPSRRNGVPRHRVVAFGGKTADQAPRPPPTGPQGGRRGLVIALHRRHWRGRAFRLRPQPERPPGCRRRGLRLVACNFGPLSIRILYARRVAQRRAMLMRVAVGTLGALDHTSHGTLTGVRTAIGANHRKVPMLNLYVKKLLFGVGNVAPSPAWVSWWPQIPSRLRVSL
jgi:hypothetical protein